MELAECRFQHIWMNEERALPRCEQRGIRKRGNTRATNRVDHHMPFFLLLESHISLSLKLHSSLADRPGASSLYGTWLSLKSRIQVCKSGHSTDEAPGLRLLRHSSSRPGLLKMNTRELMGPFSSSHLPDIQWLRGTDKHNKLHLVGVRVEARGVKQQGCGTDREGDAAVYPVWVIRDRVVCKNLKTKIYLPKSQSVTMWRCVDTVSVINTPPNRGSSFHSSAWNTRPADMHPRQFWDPAGMDHQSLN